MKKLSLILGLALIATGCVSVEIPYKISASHVLISYKGSRSASASRRSRSEAKRFAKSIAKKAEDGADFASLARQHSSCSSRSRGGSLGSFRKGRMVPAFEKAAWNLDVGEVSGVVETPFGFHIIKRYR